jgi:hypothetical protein
MRSTGKKSFKNTSWQHAKMGRAQLMGFLCVFAVKTVEAWSTSNAAGDSPTQDQDFQQTV